MKVIFWKDEGKVLSWSIRKCRKCKVKKGNLSYTLCFPVVFCCFKSYSTFITTRFAPSLIRIPTICRAITKLDKPILLVKYPYLIWHTTIEHIKTTIRWQKLLKKPVANHLCIINKNKYNKPRTMKTILIMLIFFILTLIRSLSAYEKRMDKALGPWENKKPDKAILYLENKPYDDTPFYPKCGKNSIKETTATCNE